MADYLGGYVLPQEIVVSRHPFTRQQEAIQIYQPYRENIDPELFQPDTALLLGENFDRMRSSYPQATAQIPEFVRRCRALNDAAGLLADTNGRRNLVIGVGEKLLAMIDGQPVGLEHPGVQPTILEQVRRTILGQYDSLELATGALAC